MLVKFAIQDYMNERELQNLSENTMKGYVIFFREFKRWLTEREIIDVNEITQSTIKSYLLYCKKERNNSTNTVNNKLKNLTAFFNHLLDNEYITKNPCSKISKLETDEKIEVFTDSHIRQMLTYYRRLKRKDHQFTAFRNSAIIITLLGTGIRIGELRNLKWSDINSEHYQLTIYGKNRKQETVPLTSKVLQELLEYKLFCERHFKTLNDYVFVNRDGSPMSYDATKSVFKRLQEVMNFKDVRLSAHTFRHTFTQKFLLGGGDVCDADTSNMDFNCDVLSYQFDKNFLIKEITKYDETQKKYEQLVSFTHLTTFAK